jgi:hypothetical protein
MTESLAIIQVEVLDPVNARAVGNAQSKLGPKVEYVAGSTLATVANTAVEGIEASDIRRGIEAISSAVSMALENAAPETWTVELNLGFKAGLKVPVLMSGEANAALKVTMNWKKPT